MTPSRLPTKEAAHQPGQREAQKPIRTERNDVPETTAPDGGSVPFYAEGERPCESCGAPCPEGYYHVAIHDCATGKWDLITITPRGWKEVGR